MRSIIVALVVGLSAIPAQAWSNKEHIQLTRLAAERLIADPKTPPEMKAWLEKALPYPLSPAEEQDYFLHKRIGLVPRGVDGLTLWATMPDMLALLEGGGEREKKIEPYGVGERMMHFIDLEYFTPDESKRSYSHDLTHKPSAGDIPRDLADPRWQRSGVLPFRVQECYRNLVKAIRENRLIDEPGRFPRDEHAVKWAGFLAHYAEDNTQPQHATADYKSSAYFANKFRAPNVHAEVEYKMCDDEFNDYPDLRREFWPLFVAEVEKLQDPIESEDPWLATVQVSLASYDALPLIGLAAMAATKQGGTPEHPAGPIEPFDTVVFFHFKGRYMGRDMTVMEMKAHQTAWAVHRVERLWLQAWQEAHESAPPAAPSTGPVR